MGATLGGTGNGRVGSWKEGRTEEAALLEPGAGREQACWAHKGQNCSSVGVLPR